MAVTDYAYDPGINLLGPYRCSIVIATAAYVLTSATLAHESRAIICAKAGKMKVRLAGDSAAKLLSFPAGETKVAIIAAYSTGTTVTGVTALY